VPARKWLTLGIRRGLRRISGELTIMQKTLVNLLLIMVIGVLAACSNTADGAGRDVEHMGQWMQDKF